MSKLLSKLFSHIAWFKKARSGHDGGAKRKRMMRRVEIARMGGIAKQAKRLLENNLSPHTAA